ncbi:MAG: hypothetical protein QOF35_292, partial [Actinomycetota bacterium]|nr:hypothetical protein [Actinomycetota bacterium]
MIKQARLTNRSRRRFGAGLVATTVALVGLPLAAISASALLDPNAPPTAPHSIIVFPARDFVHLDGYAASDLVTVKIMRRGFEVGTTLPFHPNQLDPATGKFMADINHLGEPCWSGVTPDIGPGDVVQVLTAPGAGDQTPTSGVTVTSPATETAPGSGIVVMTGTAPDATAPGGRTPIDQLNSRIIAKKELFSNGKRLLRADSTGAKGATIAYDGLSSNWTATFSGLNTIAADGIRDADKAVNQGESRGQWLGRVPLAVSENTIFEWNIIGGPAAGCNAAPAAPAPTVPQMTSLTDTGVSALDGLTRNTRPTFVGATGDAAATNATLYVDSVPNGTATVVAGNYSLTPATALTQGTHTVQVSETKAPALTESISRGSLSVSIDTTLPLVTARTPGVNATKVLQAGNLSATFGEKVFGVTNATFTLKNTLTNAGVGAAATYNSTTRVAVLNPTTTLAAGTRYTATLTAGIKDLAGNPVTATSWTFTTGPRPTVISKSPAANALGVSRVANATATFSENVSGVSRSTFKLKRTSTGAAVTVVVSYNSITHVATMNPSVTLAASTKYTATLAPAAAAALPHIKDAEG